jgi:hypothetical protein
LAIKAYLRHHMEYAELTADPCVIPDFEEGDERSYDAHLDMSILKDAVRFAPELAPLAASVLDAGRKNDREPEILGFGEPDEHPRS